MSISTLPVPAPLPVVSSSLDEVAAPARRESRAALVCLGVVLVSAAYVYWHLGRGLVPHDDGAIAHSAERVLRGELPHRDFDEIYTGGLSWLNAVAFRALGISLWSMRLALFAAFLAWVPAVFYVATRFVRALAAGALTLLAVAWSVPNYPAPMPSWYNLFFATFGVALLLKHLEKPRRRWLVMAGVVGGLSVLMKVVGLYYVAGVLLWLLFRSQEQAREAEPSGRSPVFATMVTALLLCFVAALAGLVRRELRAPEVVHFVMPGTLLAALLIRREWRGGTASGWDRFRALAALVWPFLLGVALPVIVFALPYVASGSVGALINGVFILPTRRFGAASVRVLPLLTMLTLLPAALLLVTARRWPSRVGPLATGALVAALLALLAGTAYSDPLYKSVWFSARNLVPVLTVVGVVVLMRDVRSRDAQARDRLMLLLCVTALCSLVQFPFAVPVYFCYVAPLVVLLAAALFPYLRPMPRAVPAALLGFCLAFAVLRVNDSTIYGMGIHYLPYLPVRPLALERGGLDVFDFQADEYAAVNALLAEHAKEDFTWASPDSPEVYFLSGRRNPTRSLFEFFDDSTRREERLLASLDAHGVTAIVLNRQPDFSPPITNEMFARLAQRFPASADAGHFHVRWRR